ncbi:hypothetical protein RISK_002931 [Rhodopirellula islandica]|uniref:Uncharacterized protein n=1 Tax=Rhodopirellula islandica TaxID=595434 RepID=A0A0J1EHZ6_RHOIS|nr:hypothetical protein RISK_002931 [Rhodopirellula islandica]
MWKLGENPASENCPTSSPGGNLDASDVWASVIGRLAKSMPTVGLNRFPRLLYWNARTPTD